jgi:hypothetical protein
MRQDPADKWLLAFLLLRGAGAWKFAVYGLVQDDHENVAAASFPAETQ